MAKEEEVLLDQIVAAVEEACGVAESLKGKKFAAALKIISDVLPDIVEQVELVGDGLGSADKRELAILAIHKYFNVKVLPDGLEKKILGILIDSTVKGFNKLFGKDWINKVNKAASKVWAWFKKLFKKV